MSVVINKNHAVVTRHYIILVYYFAKFAFHIAISAILFYVIFHYSGSVPADLLRLIIFPLALTLLNYAFVKYALALINYHNKLIIILPEKIVLIESTLIIREDIEIIELKKVVKMDIECHGLLAVLLGYGNITIEQQRNDVRTLHFLPDPYNVLNLIKERTNFNIGVRG